MDEIRYFNTNGIITFNKPYSGFFIYEYKDINGKTHHTYNEENKFYDIDSSLVLLYDVFTQKCFPDIDEYYSNISNDSIFLSNVGLNSEFIFGKKELEEFIKNNSDNKKIFKKLYLEDCFFLIETLQDLILASNIYFKEFYKELCFINIEIYERNTTMYCISDDCRKVFSIARNLFIVLCSCFDILTKICYELENIKNCEEEYSKLSCSGKLYNPNCIKQMNFEGTIFEKNMHSNLLMDIRNDLIHNCGLEMNSKIFFKTDEKNIIEKFIYFPDFDENGVIERIKNRNRFYSKEIKLNEFLPNFYFSIVDMIENTINQLVCNYCTNKI